MNSFWRFILLGLFGAAGIGLALCLALSSPSAAEPPSGGLTTASPNAQHAANSGSASSEAGSNPNGTTVPLVEHSGPAFAAQDPKNGVLLAQANTSAQGINISPSDLMNAANLLQQSNLLNPTNGGANSQQSPGTLLGPQSTSAGSAPGTGTSQADVMQKLREQLQRALQAKQAASGGENVLPTPPDPVGIPATNSSNATAPASNPGAMPRQKPRITKLPGDGDNNLSIHIQDSDLRDVLELLSEQGDLNILPSPSVQGKVSASLTGVNIDNALTAILRSTGFVAKREGKFIYVGTPQDFKTMAQSVDTVGTRVYHLSYIRAADVQALIQPLLTPGIGTSSVTQPANEGIAADGDKAGGNQFASGDAVVVHDFVAVLNQVDQVIAEVDRKPAQVAIDAMILKVTLEDKYSFGVDFAFLRNNPNVRLFTGSPLGDLASLKPNGGLSFAFLDSSTAAFVTALESIGDTNIVASPHLMVIDKARAEILIGNQDGYVNSTITETSTAQNVQFLETGAQLRLRPFISPDGMVRMEVHPELSTGNVEVTAGPNPLTLPHKDVTQVTTNIMVPDGCTVVIGGLMREELDTTTKQIPFFGSLPGVGFLFRHKDETTAKKEIIVLITPHIVCDSTACCEGDREAAEFHRRQAVYADQMSPLGKRYLGRKYYRLAQAAWAKQDREAALRFVDLAIHFDPLSRAAINLRVDIWNGNLTGQHTLLKPGMFAQDDAMPMLELPNGPMPEGSPGQPLNGPSGIRGEVPFGDPPMLPGVPHSGAPSAEPNLIPGGFPGSATPSANAAPQKIESVPAGKPLTSDVQIPSTPPISSREKSNTSSNPSQISVLIHPLDANNRMPAWMLDRLKQPSSTDGTSRTGAVPIPQTISPAPQTSVAAPKTGTDSASATESAEQYRYEN